MNELYVTINFYILIITKKYLYLASKNRFSVIYSACKNCISAYFLWFRLLIVFYLITFKLMNASNVFSERTL